MLQEGAEIDMPFSVVSYLIEHFNLGKTGWATAVIFIGILLCIVVPYLLGSINFAIILSKKYYKKDIRNFGSGNAGTTNMLRVYGKKIAVFTFLGDMLKAAVAVVFGAFMISGITPLGGYIAAFFVIFGHMFPIFYKFKGGKGVACTAIAILILSPITFLIAMGIFLIIAVGTKYISLASVMSALVLPFILFRVEGPGTHVLFMMLISVFVIFMHRGNIKRLREGTESKISFKRKKKENEKNGSDSDIEPVDNSENSDKTVNSENKNTKKRK